MSAIFICWENQRLGIRRSGTSSPLSSWKLLSLAFAICGIRDDAVNIAACLEWAIAFIFTFYIFSFVIDLLPAADTKNSSCKFDSEGEGAEIQQEQEQNNSGAEGRVAAESQ